MACAITNILFLGEVLLFIGFATFAFIKTYFQTLHRAHLYMAAVMLLFTLGNFLGFFTCFFNPNAGNNVEKKLKSLIYVVNILFAGGSIALIFSISKIMNNTITLRNIILAILIGYTTAILLKPKKIEVSFDDQLGVWLINYQKSSSHIFIIVAILFMLTLISFIGIKIIQSVKNKKISGFLVGSIIFIAWTIMVFIPKTEILRRFLLPLGLGIIGLGTFLDPFDFLITTKYPKEVLLFDSSNQLLFRYNFETREISDNTDTTYMLKLNDYLITEELQARFSFHHHITDKLEIFTFQTDIVQIMILGSKIDANIIAGITLTIGQYLRDHHNGAFVDADSLTPSRINELTRMLQHTIDKITINLPKFVSLFF